jgi:D-xylose transport system substrate-binding protein
MKNIAIIIVVLMMVGAFTGLFLSYLNLSSPSSEVVTEEESLRIGFSLGTNREERWQRDVDNFTARAEALGATVEVAYAGEDAHTQIAQAENLIIKGVQALVVLAADTNTAHTIVERAHEAGVEVIAYDRLIQNADVDLFLTFDTRLIAEGEAREITRLVPQGKIAYVGGASTDSNSALHEEGAFKVLQPLIDKGDIEIAYKTFTLDTRPEEAYKTMKAYLDAGGKVDGVICMNDGTAGGVIQALAEHGLAGKVPVAGADADLAAVQRIVAGTQAATMFTPLSELDNAAAEAAVAFARGENPRTNGILNNGKLDVPTYFFTPELVVKSNIDEIIIDSGFHSRASVYGAQ